MDAPEANTAVLSFVQDADFDAPFLVGIHCLLEKIVLILLTTFEDNAVTVIGGLCVFSPLTFFWWENSPSNKCRELAIYEEQLMEGEFISVCVLW